MENKLVSVIVPVYNVEEYLVKSVDSILNQTYENLEIILVDDGSTDMSGAMCDSFKEQDGRIKVIHKKNGGLSDARNAGLEIATGDYIGYVDSDDWAEPDMFELMVTNCEKYGADVAACRYSKVYRDFTVNKSTDLIIHMTRDEALETYICENVERPIYNSVWSKLFKRDLVKDYRFPVGKKSEDIMYTTKAFCNMNSCVYIDKALYNYVCDREGSIMAVKNGKHMLEDELPFFREGVEYIREHVSEELGDKAFYHYCKRIMLYFLDYMRTDDGKYYAFALADMLRDEKREIIQVYEEPFVKRGDRVRMNLMLKSPRLYYMFADLYDKTIVRMKNR
jgi:glycosyltransferase involved in cell wall biosynthesis